MIGVLVSGEGTNLQALLDAGLPVVAVASNARGVRALERAEAAAVPAAAFPLADFAGRGERDAAMAEWVAAAHPELELTVADGESSFLPRSDHSWFARTAVPAIVNEKPHALLMQLA